MALVLDPPRSRAVLPVSLLIVALFAAGLVGTFTVGGSGAGTSLVVGGEEAKLVPAAAETTAKAGSAKFELTVTASVNQGLKIDSTSTGAFDFVAGTASMQAHSTLPAGLGTVDSVMLVDGANLYL